MRRCASIGGRSLWLAAAATLLSGCAADVGEHYRYLEASYQLNGAFRVDTNPDDVPFNNDDLRRNFIEIALFSEFASVPGAVPERTAKELTRWEQPIRYRFLGSEVDGDDRRDVRELAERLQTLSGIDFSADAEDPNLWILILTEEERDAYIERMKADVGEDAIAFQATWADELRYPCVAQFLREEGEIVRAFILIKAELQGLFRKSCLHEEIAQSLGLTNDSEEVRPSLFNDSQEFALLTEHDEYLLRILYDDRLAPGMNAGDVEPLLDAIIADIRPEDGV